MPLRLDVPPPESLFELRRSLQRLEPVTGGRGLHAAEAAAEAAAVSRGPIEVADLCPHQVYALRLDQIQDEHSMSKARPVAWRYLMDADEQHPMAAEISQDAGTSQHRFGTVDQGDLARATSQVVKKLQASPSEYELRLLDVPALHLVALWLRRQGSADLFLPLTPVTNRPHLQHLGSVSEEEWGRTLLELADRKRSEPDDLTLPAEDEGETNVQVKG